MESLLGPKGDYVRTEENVKEFLRSLPDEELKNYYENIELTSFPILLVREYRSRLSNNSFKRRTNSKKSRPSG